MDLHMGLADANIFKEAFKLNGTQRRKEMKKGQKDGGMVDRSKKKTERKVG